MAAAASAVAAAGSLNSSFKSSIGGSCSSIAAAAAAAAAPVAAGGSCGGLSSSARSSLGGAGSLAAAGAQAAYKLDLPKSRFYGDEAPSEQQQQLRQSSSIQSLVNPAPEKQQLAKQLQQITEAGVLQSGSASPDAWQQQQQAASALQPSGSSGNWVIAAGTASGSSSLSWVQLEGSVDSNGSGLSSGMYLLL